MKTIILITVVMVMSINAYPQNADQVLGTLINEQNYWKLPQVLNKQGDKASDFIRLMSEGLIGFYFNRPDQAITSLTKLLGEHQATLNATGSTQNIAVLLAECYGLAGNYQNAANIYGSLISQMEAYTNIDNLGYRNKYNKYNALSKVPPQRMLLNKTTTILAKTDSVGLITVPVSIANHTMDFVFDTGAGYSLISEEYARKMGFKILDITVSVQGFNVVPMKIGVAEKIRIGDAELENIIFLVNPEKMTFPQLPNYEIKGIIGLYTMLTMREIQYDHKQGTITIPKQPHNYSTSNMILNNLALYSQAIVRTDTLTLKFDSGAVTGGLGSAYFEKHIDYIRQNGKLDSTNMGGLGGHIKGLQVYKLSQLSVQVGEGRTIVPNVEVQISPSEVAFLKNEGVLGLDYIHLFNKMIISLKDMYLTFEQ